MKRLFTLGTLILTFVLFYFSGTSLAHAATCSSVGGVCVVSGSACVSQSGTVDTAATGCGAIQVCCRGATSSVFGKIEAPQGVDKYNAAVPGANGIGVILFASNLIKLVTIIAGIIVFVNIILAGYNYITADGNASAHEKARNQITMSFIGLILIIMAYTITALISLFVFGDAGYILNPVIPTAP